MSVDKIVSLLKVNCGKPNFYVVQSLTVLDETDSIRLFAEALTADVETVFANDTSVVTTDAAVVGKRWVEGSVLFKYGLIWEVSRTFEGSSLSYPFLSLLTMCEILFRICEGGWTKRLSEPCWAGYWMKDKRLVSTPSRWYEEKRYVVALHNCWSNVCRFFSHISNTKSSILLDNLSEDICGDIDIEIKSLYRSESCYHPTFHRLLFLANNLNSECTIVYTAVYHVVCIIKMSFLSPPASSNAQQPAKGTHRL